MAKATGAISGFMDFVRTQGVVGLAVGLTIGTAVTVFVKSLVDNLVNPLIGVLLPGSSGLQNKFSCLQSVHGACTNKLAWGVVLSNFISFLTIALVVYFAVHGLKLDRIDKKEGRQIVPKPFTDEELKEKLTPEQYHVLREKGTEAPFSGKFYKNKDSGMYVCPVCGNELFSSEAKYDSDTPGLAGWPSFYDVAKTGSVKLEEDNSMGMHRIEATCAVCGSHLGHLFDDDTSPNGKHFCINSASLAFMPADKVDKK